MWTLAVKNSDELIYIWSLYIFSASEVTTVWHYRNSIIIIIIICLFSI